MLTYSLTDYFTESLQDKHCNSFLQSLTLRPVIIKFCVFVLSMSMDFISIEYNRTTTLKLPIRVSICQ